MAKGGGFIRRPAGRGEKSPVFRKKQCSGERDAGFVVKRTLE